MRTRGSIKRRPPSRRFRKSQSEFGELGDLGALELSQENGAREETGDEALQPRSEGPGSPQPGEEAGRIASRPLGAHESRTDPQEGEAGAPEKAAPPPPGPGAEAPGAAGQSGCGAPAEAGPAAEQGLDTQRPEEEAGGQESPRSCPGGAEGSGEGAHEDGAAPEPGCHPRTGREDPETEVGGSTSGSSPDGRDSDPCPGPCPPTPLPGRFTGPCGPEQG